jgi:hypothetical protein
VSVFTHCQFCQLAITCFGWKYHCFLRRKYFMSAFHFFGADEIGNPMLSDSQPGISFGVSDSDG